MTRAAIHSVEHLSAKYKIAAVMAKKRILTIKNQRTMKFLQMTKKNFIEALNNSNGELLKGGFTKNSLDDENFNAEIAKKCNQIEVIEPSKIIIKGNKLRRYYIDDDGKETISCLDFNPPKAKSVKYYSCNNVYAIETSYKDYEKNNIVIYKLI